MPTELTFHDYCSDRSWGHDYVWRPEPGSEGTRGHVTGWGVGLAKGHILILRGERQGPVPYRITQIEYCANPPDMWRARVKHDPDILCEIEDTWRLGQGSPKVHGVRLRSEVE